MRVILSNVLHWYEIGTKNIKIIIEFSRVFSLVKTRITKKGKQTNARSTVIVTKALKTFVFTLSVYKYRTLSIQIERDHKAIKPRIQLRMKKVKRGKKENTRDEKVAAVLKSIKRSNDK